MQGVLTGFAVIAVVIGVGCLIGLRGYLGDQGREVLTKLAFHVASPALLFTTLARADLSVIFSSRLLVTALSTAAAAGVFVSVGVVRGWGVGRTTIGALCSSYVNSGNLGIPIAVYVLGDASLVIRHHHERFDGSGYPEGLAGDAIPLSARIFAIADSFDAMTSDRPYRHALPLDRALGEIRGGAGSQFDPEVVEAFVDLVEEEPSPLWGPGREPALAR